MELIFNNQFSIFEDIFYNYLTPKQCTKLYSSNKILYNVYINNNKFESNYFTPNDRNELIYAVDVWCDINEDKAILRYGHISFWNTIKITNMECMFQKKSYFNADISDWNTSNVTDISNMFSYTKNFNQNLNNWNISNIRYMKFTFYNALSFNKDNCIYWDLSNIEDTNKIYMY